MTDAEGDHRAPVVRHRLGERPGERVGLTLVRVGQLGHRAERRIRAGFGIGRTRRGLRRRAEVLTAVGADELHRTQVQVLVEDVVVGLGVVELQRTDDAHPRQFAVEREGELGGVRHLEVRIDRVDRHLRHARTEHERAGVRNQRIGGVVHRRLLGVRDRRRAGARGFGRGEEVLAVAAVEQRARRAARGVDDVVGDDRRAGVAERVGVPHRRHVGDEYADAAAQLRLVFGVEVIVERHARLPGRRHARQRIVGVAEAALGRRADCRAVGILRGERRARRGREAGVERRRLRELRRVQAQAVGQREPVGRLPGILQERAVLLLLEIGLRVLQVVARRRLLDRVLFPVARREISQRVVGVAADRALHEGVEDLVLAGVEAGLDGVLAEMPRAGAVQVVLSDVEGVHLARELGAEGHARGEARVGVDRDLHRRLIAAGERAAQRGDVRVLRVDFGGEHVAPIAEQLHEVALRVAIVVVPVAVRRDRGAAAGRNGLRFLGFAEAEHGAVLVVDVPVDFGQVTLVGEVRERAVAGIEAEGLRLAQHRVEERGVEAGHRRAARAVRRRGGRADADAFALFVAQEEEQRVLDDRTADGEARRPFTLPAVVRLLDAAAGQGDLAHEIVVGGAVGVIDRAVEIVGTALRHRVDVGADAAARGHVEVRGGELVRIDDVRGNRRTDAEQAVRGEAERVAGVDLVDGDAVVAEILAVRRDRAGVAVGDRDARIHARDRLERTVGVHRGFELRVRDVRRQALVVRIEHGHLRRIRRHRDALELRGSLSGFGEVDRRGFAEVEENVVGIDFFDARALSFDVVRTADAQTLRLIAAARIGSGVRRRAGGHVHDLDLGACHGRALRVDHAAGQGRGRVLCVCGNRQGRRNHARKQFDSQRILHSHSPSSAALFCQPKCSAPRLKRCVSICQTPKLVCPIRRAADSMRIAHGLRRAQDLLTRA